MPVHEPKGAFPITAAVCISAFNAGVSSPYYSAWTRDDPAGTHVDAPLGARWPGA